MAPTPAFREDASTLLRRIRAALGPEKVFTRARGTVVGTAAFAPLVLPSTLRAGMAAHRTGMVATTRGMGKVAGIKHRALEALLGGVAGGALGGGAHALRKPEERQAKGLAYDVLRGAGGGAALSLAASAALTKQLRLARAASLRGKAPSPEFMDYLTASMRRSTDAEAAAAEKALLERVRALRTATAPLPVPVGAPPGTPIPRRPLTPTEKVDETIRLRTQAEAAEMRAHERRADIRGELLHGLHGVTPTTDAGRDAARRLDAVLAEYVKQHRGLYGAWEPGSQPPLSNLYAATKR